MPKLHRWLVSALCVAMAGGFIFYLYASGRFWSEDCDPVGQINSISSPNEKLDALILRRICAGGFGSGSETYWIKVRRTGVGAADGGLNIFEVQDYRPDVAWSGPTRLVITIKTVSDISLSLHKAYDADITYRIADSLQPGRWEEEIRRYEARGEQRIRDGKIFADSPLAERQKLNEIIAGMRSDYANFLNWAARNAENAPPPKQL